MQHRTAKRRTWRQVALAGIASGLLLVSLAGCSAPTAKEATGITGLAVDESAFEPLPSELNYQPSEELKSQVLEAAPTVLGTAGIGPTTNISLGNPIPCYRAEGMELEKLATDLWPVYYGNEYIGLLVAATLDDSRDMPDGMFPLSAWEYFSLAEAEVPSDKVPYTDCFFVPRTSGASVVEIERMLTREGACAFVDGRTFTWVLSPDQQLIVEAFGETNEDDQAEGKIETADEARSGGLTYGSAVGRISLG